MARSLKKGPFVDHHLVNKVLTAVEKATNAQLKLGHAVRLFFQR